MGGERVNAQDVAAALQVIVLGSGGGPVESNTTAFLVRSLSSGWRKGSIIAVDAGVHLSAITKILRETQPPELGLTDELALPHTLTSGPFRGLEVPFASAEANAAYIHRNLIDTYLITHPHLDHISGFVINTAGLPGSRPKRLAGLPSTIAAFKTHIFNNVIWPNLSDENNGAGLVTYMRLVEGGSPALGEGEGKGYMEISDDLAVKVWGVSHGHCIEKHSHRGSDSSTRYGSMDAASMSLAMGPGVLAGSSAPSGGQRAGSASAAGAPTETVCVYDSSAYFIRDVVTGREILMFGDVEPDSISLSPRNQQIWQEAAPKIATGKLAAIFIECSFDDSQSVDRLFGHLAPRFIMQEMANLAEEREDGEGPRILTRRRAARMAVSATSSPLLTGDDPVSPKTVKPPRRQSSTLSQSQSLPDERGSGSGSGSILSTPHVATPTAELNLRDAEIVASGPPPAAQFPLGGLRVVLIHLKEKLNDGPPVGEIIRSELEEYEREAQLGCEFVISSPGEAMYF
ncbi:cyclic-AMP phosphodiesterase [Coniochaeta sp. PMI_546]|nr:cyclic-AMP phosphodiesterase [Coniochaeta sp. PMI_546]